MVFLWGGAVSYERGTPVIGPRTKTVQRFRGGLVFQAHGLLYHLTLGLRVIKKEEEDQNLRNWDEDRVGGFGDQRLQKAHDCGRRPRLPQYQGISSITR